MIQSLWKIVWRFLKELKIELLYDPAISFQKNANQYLKVISAAALFTLAKYPNG